MTWAERHGPRRSGRPPRSVLVDLDLAGPGLDLLLGVEHEPGLRWPDLVAAPDDLDGGHLLGSLPAWRGTAVLATDRTRLVAPSLGAVARVLGSLAEVADVVIDLPRGAWGTELGELVRALPGAGAVWLAAPTLGSVGAGRRAGLAAGAAGVVLRAVRGAALSPHEVATHLGVPLWAVARDERALRVAADWGQGPVGARARSSTARVDRVRGGSPSSLALVAAAVCAASDEARGVR